MKPRPIDGNALTMARKVLRECDVRSPRDIHIEAIAARYGATVLFGTTRPGSAQIVRSGRRAVIVIDEAMRDVLRWRFSAGHELAHHLLHTKLDRLDHCLSGAVPTGRLKRAEREADDFAVSLLTPASLFATRCGGMRPTVDDLEHAAAVFAVSLEVAARRWVTLTKAACAVILSRGGVVVWSIESFGFTGLMQPGARIAEASLAADVSRGRALPSETRTLPGAAWDCRWEVREQVLTTGPHGVLSWVVEARP